jgi:DNA-binding transcriptional ArsR family regulator
MNALERRRSAALFSAMGDETRLLLLSRLADGARLSITQLSYQSPVTRQAITKHLVILEQAKFVRKFREGRESLYELRPGSLDEAQRSLERISHQWDQALARLKRFVEKD